MSVGVGQVRRLPVSGGLVFVWRLRAPDGTEAIFADTIKIVGVGGTFSQFKRETWDSAVLDRTTELVFDPTYTDPTGGWKKEPVLDAEGERLAERAEAFGEGPPPDNFVIVSGGAVQNNPSIPVLDLDVLHPETGEPSTDDYQVITELRAAAAELGLGSIVEDVDEFFAKYDRRCQICRAKMDYRPDAVVCGACLETYPERAALLGDELGVAELKPDWRREVANDETDSGFADWLRHRDLMRTEGAEL